MTALNRFQQRLRKTNITKDCQPLKTGHSFAQQFEPLARKISCLDR